MTAHAEEPLDLGTTDAGSKAAVTVPDRPVDGGPVDFSDRAKAAAIHALVGGRLDLAVVPSSLFEVPLRDEAALRIDAVRIQALLQQLQTLRRPFGPVAVLRDGAPPQALPSDGGFVPDELAVMSGELWDARIELDRARLSFYELPAKQRQELLALHARRCAEANAAQRQESETQRRRREALAERQRALDAAKRARSEAERLVAEELARLLGIEQRLDSLDRDVESERAERAGRRDALLVWQRRAREALQGNADDADQTYDALRQTLRGARDQLVVALDQISSPTRQIPVLGADPLTGLKFEVNTDEVRKKRLDIERLTQNVRDREWQLREQRAADLMDTIDTLNHERLGLLGSLSVQKRAAITGFSGAGLDQARSELRHLLLVLRYHRHMTRSWVGSLRKPGGGLGSPLRRAGTLLIPWMLAVAVFLWLRRRTPATLAALERRIEEGDRAARLSRPSALLQSFRYVVAIFAPLQRLALFFAMTWLIPDSFRALLEVQLLLVIGGWILAGALVVNGINAAFAVESQAPADLQRAALRMRSLRLIGRVVVAFALILVISDRLVGQGTIYRWVFSTCWVVAVPIFLVLIRWWRDPVFAQIERVRRKSSLQRWALVHRTGWMSLPAAAVAAVHLFAIGVGRRLQNWGARFGLVRRVHAYLFRRELDKLGADRPAMALEPLPPELFAALGPDRNSERWVGISVDPLATDLVRRIQDRRGGIFAVVGARGAGKTAFLHQLGQQVASALEISCAEFDGLDAIQTRLAVLAQLPPNATLDEFGQSVDEPTRTSAAVLVDDVQTQLHTAMGGLAIFDRLLEVAQRHSRRAVWVLAVDEVIWPFLKRARGVQPIFDEVIHLAPWKEEQIGRLLDDRSADVQLRATFEDLLDELPANADELDRQEALQARRAGYYRLVWDYANGNPGIALHLWRTALVLDRQGIGHVQRLQTPNGAELERLPDPAVFALRAILQLSHAAPNDVVLATRLRPSEIAETLRYSLSRGYLVEENGRVRVSWTWLRAITRFLERRHLLVMR